MLNFNLCNVLLWGLQLAFMVCILRRDERSRQQTPAPVSRPLNKRPCDGNLDMGMGCPESLVGLNPAIQIPMSSALPNRWDDP